ncbi:MAG: MCE family protein [Planctomycetes bacterium]|nr:MCE family protein [Planctomycetota bacterium]MBM4083482.1 MCE family protein [Planctomycetota bacterium]
MSTEKKVGAFFVIGLLILAVATFKVENLGDLFKSKLVCKAAFSSANGIKPGDAVRQAGVKVGEVTDVRLADGKAEITMEVDANTPVRKDSTATITMDDMLGGKHIELSLGSQQSPLLESGGSLQALDSPSLSGILAKLDSAVSSIDDLAGDKGPLGGLKNVGGLIASAQEVVDKIKRGEGTLGKFVNDDEAYNTLTRILKDNEKDIKAAVADIREAAPEIKAAFASINKIAEKTAQGEGALGKLVNDPKLYDDLQSTVASARVLANKAEKGEGTIGKLFNETALHDDLKETAATLKSFTKKLDEGEGTFSKFVNDPAVYNQAKDAVAAINDIVQKIKRGEGTIGKLVTDEELYVKARKVLTEIEEAAKGYKEQIPIGAFTSVVFAAF